MSSFNFVRLGKFGNNSHNSSCNTQPSKSKMQNKFDKKIMGLHCTSHVSTYTFQPFLWLIMWIQGKQLSSCVYNYNVNYSEAAAKKNSKSIKD